MLEKIFLQILNMSFTASFVILFVLLARLLLKRSPKALSYALWGVVLFRLICPFSFESIFSLLPAKTNPISQDIIYATIPTIDTGIPAINHTVNQILPAAAPAASVNPMQIWVFIGATVWILGIVVLLIYSLISLMKLLKHLRKAVHERNNIYLVEHLDTPFVLGIIHSKIYLPASLTGREKQYIILHEETHIKRFDHVVKILSFFVLCLHWFNPLVWVAFFVSGRDMEMSCDERVIKQLGNDVKKEYSSSLLTLATGKHIISGTPLAFSEGDTKGRIKNVLKYRKPAFWMVVVGAIAVIIITVGLLANPMQSVRLSDAGDMNFSDGMLDKVVYGTVVFGDQVVDLPQVKAPEVADFIKELRVDKDEVSKSRMEDRDSTNQIHFAYEGYGNDGRIYNLYFNFNADFTEVWLNNGVKPGFSYPVRKPDAVKSFFERQISSTAQAPENLSAEELWKARTKYLGDNSAVGEIISQLQLPKSVIIDSFALQTSARPYGITINLKTDTETLNYYSNELHQDPFVENAIIMFTLIENVEFITFVFDDDTKTNSFQLADGVASAYLGENYFERTETLKGFNAVLQEIYEKVPVNTEKIKQQMSDNVSPAGKYEGETLRIGIVGKIPEIRESQVKFEAIDFNFLLEDDFDLKYDAIFITKDKLSEASNAEYVSIYKESGIPFYFIGNEKSHINFIREDLSYEDEPDSMGDAYITGLFYAKNKHWGYGLYNDTKSEINIEAAFSRVFEDMSAIKNNKLQFLNKFL